MYLGTTWSKIEGRFLLGTSGEGASKQTGGSMSKTIALGNGQALDITPAYYTTHMWLRTS